MSLVGSIRIWSEQTYAYVLARLSSLAAAASAVAAVVITY